MKDLFDIANKCIVITGGGGVLCGTMARELAKAGAKIAVLSLHEQAAVIVADDIKAAGGVAVAVGCDGSGGCRGCGADVLRMHSSSAATS